MLNVRRFTLKGEQTEQDVNLPEDDRLEGLVKQPIVINLNMKGQVDDNRPLLTGRAKCQLSAICQVCNDEITWQHEFEFQLTPVEQQELEQIEDHLDPVIIDEGKLDIEDMLTNELILSLPTVITHATTMDYDCRDSVRMSAGDEIAEAKSPFAILEQLKSPNNGD